MNAEQIIAEIERLPLDEVDKVKTYMRKIPNAETRAAMEEALAPEKLDTYKSADDLFKALDIQC